jgi:K+-sensing histidine kinase KdpD
MTDRLAQPDFSMVLASSVHDMKNSLGMLLNSLESEIRENPAQDQEQSERFAILQYEASRINGELIQLLSIYRMQNNHMPFRLDEHFLEDVLEEQLARNDMLFTTRSIDVDIDCDPDQAWFFDDELVGSVIHNILVNGARYSKEKMCLSAKVDNGQLVIGIADDGAGFPDMMLECPQKLMDKSVDFEEGSTHLGLYFAQCVAMLHQQGDNVGCIRLSNDSPLGGGLFELVLP